MVADSLLYHPAVSHYLKFVATTVGRDKILRTIQYFSRFYAWYLYRTNNPTSSIAPWTATKVQLGLARKIMRIGKFVEHIRAAAELYDASQKMSTNGGDNILQYLQITRQLGYAGYLTMDTLTVLDAAGIRKSPRAKEWQKQAYKAWFVGLLASAIAGVYSNYQLSLRAKDVNEKDPDAKVESKKIEKQRKVTNVQLLSDLCDLTVPSTAIGYTNFDDGIVGLAGTVSSLLGVYGSKRIQATPSHRDALSTPLRHRNIHDHCSTRSTMQACLHPSLCKKRVAVQLPQDILPDQTLTNLGKQIVLCFTCIYSDHVSSPTMSQLVTDGLVCPPAPALLHRAITTAIRMLFCPDLLLPLPSSGHCLLSLSGLLLENAPSCTRYHVATPWIKTKIMSPRVVDQLHVRLCSIVGRSRMPSASAAPPHHPQRQLAKIAISAATRNRTTSFLQIRRRYSLRQFLDPAGTHKLRSKRGCLLQYPYRASRLSPFPSSLIQSSAPVQFRSGSHHSDFSLPSWRAWLLSRGLFRSDRMASNTLYPKALERRPSAVRQSSAAPDTSKARQEVTKKQLRATHLRAMVTNSVNKTALHPGGVEPNREHTELEEELHESAHIDYDRVAIVANPSVSALYEDALVYETGSAITSSGALTAYSGAKTGRSPLDKRIVREPGSEKDVWWGPVNKEMSPEVWKINRERAVDYLNTRNRIYVVDGYAGWDERYRINVRVVCARAYHALFMRNMLIRPSREELKSFHPDYVIYNAGSFPANRYTTGMTSATSVSINFAEKEMVILGTEYAGEMKKGVFTVMFYEMPVKHNVLTLHSSANEGSDGDVTVFFGLSGTGKTTLSADTKRKLIGDDEHCWSDKGVFNIEGGCYAKCIGLSAEKEPDIYGAIKFGSILENVVFDDITRDVNYEDSRLTENTRCAYPIEYIANAKIPCITNGHPTNIVLLTCDARGVLPPISKLDTAQTMYHFISGYTSKMAGTEDGVTEPQATFSSCFAQPFLALHPMRYAKMLAEKISEHKANAWLLNTGWVGAGATTGGKRCPLKYTRAILDAIHSGELAKVEYETYDTFNLNVPKTCPNVPDDILNPKKSWTGSADFKEEVTKLGVLFRDNFKKYASEATEEVLKAGPTVDEAALPKENGEAKDLSDKNYFL